MSTAMVNLIRGGKPKPNFIARDPDENLTQRQILPVHLGCVCLLGHPKKVVKQCLYFNKSNE